MQILTSGILNDTVVYEQPGGASISSQHLNFRPRVAGERETNIPSLRSTHGIYIMYFIYSYMPYQMLACSFSLKSNVSNIRTYSVNFPFPWDLLVRGMTFSHMDIGELINLGRPPPPLRRVLIEGAPLETAFHNIHFLTQMCRLANGIDMFVEYSHIDT